MQIIQAAPPKEPTRKRVTHRRSYHELFNILRRNEGVWMAIDPRDVAGETPGQKQTMLYVAAKSRKMKIRTTAQDGLIYIRTCRAEEVTHA
jgi:hypothetical protein